MSRKPDSEDTFEPTPKKHHAGSKANNRKEKRRVNAAGYKLKRHARKPSGGNHAWKKGRSKR